MPVIWLKVYKGKQKLHKQSFTYCCKKANIMCSKNLRTRDGLDSEGAVSCLEGGSNKSAVGKWFQEDRNACGKEDSLTTTLLPRVCENSPI